MHNEANTTEIVSPVLKQPAFTATTSDGKVMYLETDLAMRTFSEQQLLEWKKAVESNTSVYFDKSTVGIQMTPEQKEMIQEFILSAFDDLTPENNFENEFVRLVITNHFIDRVRGRRKKRKINTQYSYRTQLKEFVTTFKYVDDIFRWNSDGITYRLMNDIASSERISISIRYVDKTFIVEIHCVTYFIKKNRKKHTENLTPQKAKRI